MTKRYFILSFALLFGLSTTGKSTAADAPLKVLRHLKYDVVYGYHSTSDTKVSGFGGDVSGTSSGAGPSDQRTGTITADIVAATADGGLVADVFEEAPKRTPTVRFGVTDEKMFFDQSAAIDEEEPEFVHYLARDLVKPTDLQVGTTWTDKIEADKVSGLMTYRVSTLDADAKTVVIDISGNSNSNGMSTVSSTMNGSMTYDIASSVPRRLSVTTRSLIHAGQTVTTKSTQLTATLVEDSFHKT